MSVLIDLLLINVYSMNWFSVLVFMWLLMILCVFSYSILMIVLNIRMMVVVVMMD